MDNFVIRLIYSIYKNENEFLKNYTKNDLEKMEWKNKLTDDFFMVKDTYFNDVEYLIYFNNDFVLHINVGKLKYKFYGAAVFEISDIYEEKSIEAKGRLFSGSHFYYIGKYRIYPK